MTRGQKLLIDTAMALALLTVVLCFAVQYRLPEWRAFDAGAALLTCVITLPLALRRIAPWPVLLVSCAALAAYVSLGYQPTSNIWPPMLAFFTLASLRPHRHVVPAALVVGAVWFHHAMATRAMSAPVALGQTVLVELLAWGFGFTLRRLAQRNVQLDRLTARLRAEEGARARHAVTEERLRIARELHDVVAHHLSVVALQSGVARLVFDSDADTARTALRTIEDTSRQTLEEMRGLLRVLRVSPDGTEAVAGPAAAGPGSGLAALGDLAARMTAAGLAVTTETSGAARELAPGADLCAYRIVQEALTNALKHAGPGTAVRITLGYGPAVLTVAVRDDGGPPRPAADRSKAPAPAQTSAPAWTGSGTGTGTGTGHGLIGMRERVGLYGGTFRAGPRRGGGYAVEFTLPLPVRPHPGAVSPSGR
ncbi:sensor histidine kinase [Streptomyces sp. WAC06614]|uniref:sensor histidine kinase n=1 Tax=Streptomyces sp. WAC06614 TaxID=2487416 RepID=UPI000F7A3096|nr:histidine kinase [Streptomyces sp. WAC06614]RSS76741.1 sensor histidine kinase [Streptomyces sp. WAC06614]